MLLLVLLKYGCIYSPSQGPCCTSTCEYADEVVTCRAETECSYSSQCRANNFTCPESRHKEDGTTCNGNTQICKNGVSIHEEGYIVIFVIK